MTRIAEPVAIEPIAEEPMLVVEINPEPGVVKEFARLDAEDADFEYTIRKTAVREVRTEATYDLAFLRQQRIAIVRQLDEEVSKQNKALAEVDELIAEAEKLGIKARPVEVAVEEAI